MDHVVYLDSKDKELEKILDGSKTMVIRGAAGRKLPHGRVNPGDVLYFVRNNGEGQVKAKAQVRAVFNSEKMSEDESTQLVTTHQGKLCLGDALFKRWAGKRFLVLIEIEAPQPLEPFAIDRSAYGSMDDWLPVEEIKSCMV